MKTKPLCTIIIGNAFDSLRMLPDKSVHVISTSPPYWAQRDYGLPPVYWPAISYKPMPIDGMSEIHIPAMSCCLGLEETAEAYVGHMVAFFREVKRVLRDDAVVFLNLGDGYSGPPTGGPGRMSTLNGPLDSKTRRQVGKMSVTKLAACKRPAKKGLPNGNLFLIPQRVALALQADGWYIRSDIRWVKPNTMPESCQSRPTSAHESILLLSKKEHYFYDTEAVKEASTDTEGKRKQQRNYWPICFEPNRADHPAKYPSEIPRRAILAGTSERGCCPHCGSNWVRQTEKYIKSVMSKTGKTKRFNDTKTIGWKPSCACPNNTPIPCTVLDPFAGTGTTAQAALWLGRRALLFEMSTDFVKLIRARIQQKPKWAQDNGVYVQDTDVMSIPSV